MKESDYGTEIILDLWGNEVEQICIKVDGEMIHGEVKVSKLSPEELAEVIAKYGPSSKQLERHRKLANKKSHKKCCIEGCEGKSRSRNMCHSHYRKFLRYGDPLFAKRGVN